MLWQNPPPLVGKPEHSQLWVRTATTEDLLAWNERGQEFPGGYRKLAPELQPDLIWVAWKFAAEGQYTGLSFDGAVWLPPRFAGCPPPYRVLPR
jgi:hypothetical protein